MRLSHVLDKFDNLSIEKTGDVIRVMKEDIAREGKGEIVFSCEAFCEIGKRTAKLFKEHLQKDLK